MYLLHIEHSVADFDGWKKGFDGDPVGREKSGVRRYQVSRGAENPNYVMIDLEFASQKEAAGLLAALQPLWARIQGEVIMNPQARIVEVVETRELALRPAR
jgi:hypothetical protein